MTTFQVKAIHRCHATGCGVPCPPEHLMCRRHWFMVPRPIRDAVWAAYRPGQCEDKRPSREWFAAADAAIGWVATREERSVTPAQTEALRTFGHAVAASQLALGVV